MILTIFVNDNKYCVNKIIVFVIKYLTDSEGYVAIIMRTEQKRKNNNNNNIQTF